MVSGGGRERVVGGEKKEGERGGEEEGVVEKEGRRS